MKRGSLFFILYLFVALSLVAQVSNLKVMTFNIRYNNPADSNYSWDHRKEMVAEVIKSYKPDLAGIQEALKDQVKDLQNLLKDYSWFGVGRDNGKDSGEYAVIFYRKDRIEKLTGSTFWLSETPDVPGSRSWNAACNRIVTWIKFTDKPSGVQMYLFNTHFDHISEQARENSAQLLLTRISQISANAPVIVTGDLNSTETGRTYDILTNSESAGYLKDTRKFNLKIPPEPSFSYIGFPYHPQQGNLIDFIFLKNDKDLKVKKYQIITDNKKGFYPSDHLPVMVEIGVLSIN
jgi:endonuclease/exonuclease/phosphatase family metal-dependent hydrolase